MNVAPAETPLIYCVDGVQEDASLPWRHVPVLCPDPLTIVPCGPLTPCPCRELKLGIPVTDENGNRLGESTAAAQKAIFQVVVSRIGMAAPAMGECPFLRLCWEIAADPWQRGMGSHCWQGAVSTESSSPSSLPQPFRR